MSKNKITYLKNEEGYEALEFLHFAKDHYASSICLVNRVSEEYKFSYLDSAIYLGHLAIELLLKAIALESKKRCIKTHNLVQLCSDAEISLVDGDSEFIKVLDRFCEQRFPSVHGANEIGQDTFMPLQKIWRNLYDKIPETLIRKWDERTALGYHEKNGRILAYKVDGEFLNECLTIKEASELLGVTKQTLRNWDKDGILTAVRKPGNNYRLYRRSELLKLKQVIPIAKRWIKGIKL
ncbi:MAG: MerR family DNA-binding transcriptional regulator [Candidatus Margulisiibacteriota bacterium]